MVIDLVDAMTSHLAQLVAILPLREKVSTSIWSTTSDLSVMGSPEALHVSAQVPHVLSSNLTHKYCKSIHLAIMNMQAANISQIIEPLLCRVYPESPPQP